MIELDIKFYELKDDYITVKVLKWFKCQERGLNWLVKN